MALVWGAQVQRLLDAMEAAEGGREALVRAVRCSIPSVRDYADARHVAETTVLHAVWDFAMQDPEAFARFLAARWAPVGAPNDPGNLNANWPGNVLRAWRR